MFVLYDGRAKTMSTDDAVVLDAAEDEAEAEEAGRTWRGYDAIWYQYDVTEKNELVKERIRWDLPPNGNS